MVGVKVDEVIVELKATTEKAKQNVVLYERQFKKSTDNIEASARKANAAVERNLNSMANAGSKSSRELLTQARNVERIGISYQRAATGAKTLANAQARATGALRAQPGVITTVTNLYRTATGPTDAYAVATQRVATANERVAASARRAGAASQTIGRGLTTLGRLAAGAASGLAAGLVFSAVDQGISALGKYVKQAVDAREKTKSLEDAMSALATATDNYVRAAKSGETSTADLQKAFGEQADAMREVLEARRLLAADTALRATEDAVKSINAEFGKLLDGGFILTKQQLDEARRRIQAFRDELAKPTDQRQSQIDLRQQFEEIRKLESQVARTEQATQKFVEQFGLTGEAAAQFADALAQFNTSPLGSPQQIDAGARLLQIFRESGQTLGEIPETNKKIIESLASATEQATKAAGATELIQNGIGAAATQSETFKRSLGEISSLMTTIATKANQIRIPTTRPGNLSGPIPAASPTVFTGEGGSSDLQGSAAEDDLTTSFESQTTAISGLVAATDDLTESRQGATAAGQQLDAATGQTGGQSFDAQRQELILLTDAYSTYGGQLQATVTPLSEAEVRAEALRIEQELLARAMQEGIAITPQLRGEISSLASSYAQAKSEASGFSGTLQQNNQSISQFGSLAKDALKGFISDLRAGKSASEALYNVVNRLADRLIDISLNALFGGLGGSAGGGLFGFAGGGVPSERKRKPRRKFAGGGIIRGAGTGTSDSIIAATPRGPIAVSNGEMIMTADATRQNRQLLEALNRGLKVRGKFATGGVPSGGGSASSVSLGGVTVITVRDEVEALRAAATQPRGRQVLFNFERQNKQALAEARG